MAREIVTSENREEYNNKKMGIKHKKKEDYRGHHKAAAPEGSAPLHKLDSNGVYPSDVYSSKGVHYYGTGESHLDKESFKHINASHNKPEHELTMYRAVPKHVKEINHGDWVTTNKEYAHNHGEAHLDNDFHVLSKKVKAGHLYTNGDSIHEYGYFPSEEKSK